MSAVISESLCTGCGLCAKVCPSKCISVEEKAAVNDSRCLSCGHCGAVCLAGAVSSEGFKAFSVHDVEGLEVERILQGKRSVREFLPDAIPKEILSELVRYGEMAPSSRNTRGRKYFVVTGSRVTELEREVIAGLNSVAGPAAFLVPVLRLFSRKRAESLSSLKKLFSSMQSAFDSGKHPVLCGAPAVICIASPASNMQGKDDCVCSEQYLMLYAESIGVASCINGFTQIAHKNAERFLGVPKGYTIHAAVMLGYPKYSYKRYVRYGEDITWVE